MCAMKQRVWPRGLVISLQLNLEQKTRSGGVVEKKLIETPKFRWVPPLNLLSSLCSTAEHRTVQCLCFFSCWLIQFSSIRLCLKCQRTTMPSQDSSHSELDCTKLDEIYINKQQWASCWRSIDRSIPYLAVDQRINESSLNYHSQHLTADLPLVWASDVTISCLSLFFIMHNELDFKKMSLFPSAQNDVFVLKDDWQNNQ